MQIVSGLFYLIVLYSVFYGILKKDRVKAGLTLENTGAIKGLLAISIVLCHLSSHTDWHLPLFSFTAMGSIGVGCFFFLSGHGLVMAANKPGYFNGFLIKHTKRLLLPFGLMLILWLIFIQGILGHPVSELLHLFIIGAPVNNSWYVFAALYCYLLFWIGFRRSKQSGIIIILSGLLAWILLTALVLRWPDWWYKTIVCFLLGILWGVNAEQINSFVRKHYIPAFAVTALLLIISYLIPKLCGGFIHGDALWLINDIAMGISGALFIAVALQKLSIQNPISCFLGRISNGIYLVHGFVIECFENVYRGG